MASRKVVLADDEENLGQLVKFKLERSGFTVTWKTDGVQALEAVRAERPDLVILDVMMPRMSGYEVLEKIKSDAELKAIPVIMLTAQSQSDDVKRGLELGAVDYLTKPFRPGDLVERIKRLFPET